MSASPPEEAAKVPTHQSDDLEAMTPRERDLRLKRDLGNVSLVDRLRRDIERLSRRRRVVYQDIRRCRREGHLVPDFMGEELTENGLALQRAMEQLAEATTGLG